MGSMKLILFLLLFHLFVSPSTTYFQYDCSDTYGNYTNDSAYKENLDKLLSHITYDMQINYGFYNFSVGKESDQVNVIALCRGDITFSDCHRCLESSIQQAKEICPYQKQVILWYDNCMLRYSNRSIFGTMEEDPGYYDCSPINASNANLLWKSAGELIQYLQNEAAKGDSRQKFATGTANVSNTLKVYGLVQCTPDLSVLDCFNCLQSATNYMLQSCDGRQGARDVEPSCSVRFEINQFYGLNNTPLLQPPPAPRPPSSVQQTAAAAAAALAPSTSGIGKDGGSSKVIIGTILAAAFLLVVIIVACFLIRQRRRAWRKVERRFNNGDEVHSIESLQFDVGIVRVATGNFSDANRLGQGGFGAVYKGTLSNGQEIAVKRIARYSEQGELEFKNEVLLVAKLQHRNLVRLLGFCSENEERLLIYEFVPNSSLDYLLFDRTRRTELDWEKRYRIIGGIARGLLYLHEDSRLRIIHRDVKPSNILIDAEMYPKISDFGVARLFQVNQTHADTRRIVGTHGYMAPEYALYGFFSTKSDVYSFGVLVLEIVTGKRCFSFSDEAAEPLISKVWRNWSEGKPLDVVDPIVLAAGSEPDIMRCLHIGLLCVQDDAGDRPTMSCVVLMLSSQFFALPIPSQPMYVMNRNMNLLSSSREGTSLFSSPKRQPMIKGKVAVEDLEYITDIYPR